jgi:hypothetical protein
MNCFRQQVETVRMAALLILFVFTAAAFPPLHAQTNQAVSQVASASWLQSGYTAAHVGYNPKETTLSTANVQD